MIFGIFYAKVKDQDAPPVSTEYVSSVVVVRGLFPDDNSCSDSLTVTMLADDTNPTYHRALLPGIREI